MRIFVAKSIMNAVRAFYAGHGPKSNNKVYIHSSQEKIGFDEFDAMRSKHLVKMGRQRVAPEGAKETQRNDSVDRIGALGLRFSGTGNTIYERGESIWRKGAGGAELAGNCGEMASLSAYLAVAEHHIDPKTVWLVEIRQPGDHAFCLIGPAAPPNWDNVNAMGVYGSDTASAVVVDPWLHTACHAVNYPEFADTQVKKWQRDGKRIAWSGADGTRPGWYDPSQTYAHAFLNSRLGFVNCKTRLWQWGKHR